MDTKSVTPKIYVSVTGLKGAGKTSLIRLFRNVLIGRGYSNNVRVIDRAEDIHTRTDIENEAALDSIMQKGTIVELDEIDITQLGKMQVTMSPQQALAIAMTLQMLREHNKKVVDPMLELMTTLINSATVKKTP